MLGIGVHAEIFNHGQFVFEHAADGVAAAAADTHHLDIGRSGVNLLNHIESVVCVAGGLPGCRIVLYHSRSSHLHHLFKFEGPLDSFCLLPSGRSYWVHFPGCPRSAGAYNRRQRLSWSYLTAVAFLLPNPHSQDLLPIIDRPPFKDDRVSPWCFIPQSSNPTAAAKAGFLSCAGRPAMPSG